MNTHMLETIRTLQGRTIWGAHSYTTAFQADPRPHRDAAHALAVHVPKAIGKAARFLREHAHHAQWKDCSEDGRQAFLKAIADVLICTLRGANTIPNTPIDLAAIFEDTTDVFRGELHDWSLEDPLFRLLESMGHACDAIDGMDHDGMLDRAMTGRCLCLLWQRTVHVLAIVTDNEDPDVLAIVEARLAEKGIGPSPHCPRCGKQNGPLVGVAGCCASCWDDLELGCRAAKDGECRWKHCPQLRDGEPEKSRRHCPLDHPCEDL